MQTFVLHLDAGHDANGNPRRVYVIYDHLGNIIETIDERYNGSGAWSKKYPEAVSLGRYPTTATTRREILKLKPVEVLK